MRDEMDFSNKTVLITGSTRGIGRATAELFCCHGANVVVNGITKENVERAKKELEKRGYSILAVEADVSKEKDAERLVDAAIGRFGRIDVLINNAGISQQKTLEEITDSDWKSMLGTHIDGTFFVSRAVVPLMKRQGAGVIINIASQSVVSGGVSSVHYASAKGGVVAFTLALSAELGTYGIRVNAVMPGLIKTDLTASFEASGQYKKIVDSIPLGRAGLPSEVAGACLFLASDLASYITGEILAVNGGLPLPFYV